MRASSFEIRMPIVRSARHQSARIKSVHHCLKRPVLAPFPFGGACTYIDSRQMPQMRSPRVQRQRTCEARSCPLKKLPTRDLNHREVHARDSDHTELSHVRDVRRGQRQTNGQSHAAPLALDISPLDPLSSPPPPLRLSLNSQVRSFESLIG